eukprot:GCRY01002049.1.p1 GENE.GCRY01002049.1~~GCRY01002049.1.p1  ORF type:complete len:579 (-),score=217.83 GCRY01002049.1:177-1913(-)
MNRPGSGIARPPSSGMARPPSGAARGGVGGLGARPGSRGGRLGTGSEFRPATSQQMPPGTSFGGRTVLDASYYVGLLRMKISELSNEIMSLQTQSEGLQIDEGEQATLQRKAESSAKEVREQLQRLGDYNMASDKLQEDVDFEDVKREADVLKQRNAQLARKCDLLFSERSQKEDELTRLQRQLDDARATAEQQLSQLGEDERGLYEQLKEENAQLKADHKDKLAQMRELIASTRKLEDELRVDPVKRKAVVIFDRMSELEAAKAQLVRTARGTAVPATPAITLTPAQEREQLLVKVREDNAAMAEYERDSKAFVNEMDQLREEREALAAESMSQQGEKANKMEELMRRDEEFTAFIDNFETTKKNELKEIAQAEEFIVGLLEHISKGLEREHSMPSEESYKEMAQDLQTKKEEAEKSQSTQEKLLQELSVRKKDLEDVENLEERMAVQSAEAHDQIRELQTEIDIFSEIEALKARAAASKETLLKQKEKAAEMVEALQEKNLSLSKEHAQLVHELEDNEAHVHLTGIEARIALNERNNFALQQFIDARERESDVTVQRLEVERLLLDLNTFHQQQAR